jgi:hypothetical protein
MMMNMFGPDMSAKRPEAHGLFRKTFTLAQVPARAPARITADSRYILYVNGQEAFRGPVRSQPRRLYYDLLDLAAYLKPGENIIAVNVRYYGKPNSYWIPAPSNMTLGQTGVFVFEADLGDAGWLVSDESWQALRSDAWTELSEGGDMVSGGVPSEILDGRRYPAGWEQPGFDAKGWGSANRIPAVHIGGFAHTQPPTDPYGPMYPRTIARLGGQTHTPVSTQVETLPAGALSTAIAIPGKRVENSMQAQPTHTQHVTGYPFQADLPADGGVRLVLDFGRIVSGLVQFELVAPAGTTLDLTYTEDPIVLPLRGFGGLPAGTRYIARGAKEGESFQTSDSYGFRYLYAVVHGASGPLTVKRFAVREQVYPWTAGASFACSDEELTRLYKAGVRTVQMNSHDAFLDCPTREQRAWVGDSVVHQMVHLATNLDWRLAWHYLTLGNSPRPDGILPMSVAGEVEFGGGYTIPDWSLHWVHGVYNLYRFSGDKKAVATLLPTVKGILHWYQPFQTEQGALKDVTEWNLVDWAALSVEDTSSIITALWARGLRELSEMAGWLQEKSTQAWADDAYARVKAGFEMFWDEPRGSYVDHIKDGERCPEMSQLGGAFAILADLAPRERWARIIDTITDANKLVVRSWTGGGSGDYEFERIQKQFQGIYEPDWDVQNEIVIGQPFISYTVHDAVAKAGLADRLPALYRRWLQFLVNGFDTIGECWGWGTHVHGWSSTPTKDMVFYTLGVTPAEPGYTTARIAPRLGELAWAEGDVPTPHGLIHVRATKDKVSIQSPVPVVVDLPGQAPQSLPAGQHEVAVK